MSTPRVRYRIAVVGGGAAGLVAASALLSSGWDGVDIDVFDRRPTPFGMFRYGVAPDHTHLRTAMRDSGRVLDEPGVRFFGLVEVGRDLHREELLAGYDAVVSATGADRDRLLGVPGEDLPGVESGRRFAEWCAGATGATPFDLTGVEDVVVVGLGDVAVDLARLLLKEPEELASTDMPSAVLEHLAEHRVRRVTILVRRGPQHCLLKPRELATLLTLPGVAVEFDASALPDDVTGVTPRGIDALEVWREAASRVVPDPHATLSLSFWHRPTGFTGVGRLSSVVVEPTRSNEADSAVPVGGSAVLPAQLALRVTGARGESCGSVPFDEATGLIPTSDGRVVDLAGSPQPREYAVGWVASGWIGGFGTQRRAAQALAERVAADFEGVAPTGATGVDELLAARGVRPVGVDGWRRIEDAERAVGEAGGRERERIADQDALLRIARGE